MHECSTNDEDKYLNLKFEQNDYCMLNLEHKIWIIYKFLSYQSVVNQDSESNHNLTAN